MKSSTALARLFFFLILSFSFFSSSGQKVSNLEGYILSTKGVELRTSVSRSSSVNAFIPYGTKVKIIRSTDTLYPQGLLSCYLQFVYFNGRKGYCPSMYISQYPLPELSDTSVRWLSKYLQSYLPKNAYFYSEKYGEDYSRDSFFIKGLSIADCYYLEKRFFLDSEYMLPDTLLEGTTTYKSATLRITSKRYSSSGTVSELDLNWLFDGGDTEMRIRQLMNGSCIVISYNPD